MPGRNRKRRSNRDWPSTSKLNKLARKVVKLLRHSDTLPWGDDGWVHAEALRQRCRMGNYTFKDIIAEANKGKVRVEASVADNGNSSEVTHLRAADWEDYMDGGDDDETFDDWGDWGDEDGYDDDSYHGDGDGSDYDQGGWPGAPCRHAIEDVDIDIVEIIEDDNGWPAPEASRKRKIQGKGKGNAMVTQVFLMPTMPKAKPAAPSPQPQSHGNSSSKMGKQGNNNAQVVVVMEPKLKPMAKALIKPVAPGPQPKALPGYRHQRRQQQQQEDFASGASEEAGMPDEPEPLYRGSSKKLPWIVHKRRHGSRGQGKQHW
eukprot:TRINITY_DN91993_c0_g1_i1.p1 TRINITY_DN91993_c0_g1~~TRINITY_DN91993_c0_g1_i1.p1  ORF type:complete len:317 (+),score=73.52 TRINITY_DN91993_c0_g1_i1:115-1065(+)